MLLFNYSAMKCTGGKIYMACGPSKGQAVCGTSTEIFEEDDKCVEGCYCPQGTVIHDSRCITRDKCPCRLRGKNFPAGTSVPKKCNTCTCSEGQWVCTQVKENHRVQNYICYKISVSRFLVVLDVRLSVILITPLLMENVMISWDSVHTTLSRMIIFLLKLKM